VSKYAKEIDEATPNLIPIMNLFTALIPFLLMSAVFFRLSIIQISVPVASESGETDISKEEDKITLNMQIFPDRFELSASSDSLQPDVLAKLQATIRKKTDIDDPKATFEEITKAAHQIKGQYITSDTVIVVPEDEVPYEDVVGGVDAVRKIVLERDGLNSVVSLFPKVVLSSRVK